LTEYGIAYLFGKNLRQRAKALIDIAHPNDRENWKEIVSSGSKFSDTIFPAPAFPDPKNNSHDNQCENNYSKRCLR